MTKVLFVDVRIAEQKPKEIKKFRVVSFDSAKPVQA